MTEYRVRFEDGQSTTIRADKTNLGLKKLWFYDADDHLIAVYLWEQLMGFEVIGSAAEQVFVDRLLHEYRANLPIKEQQQAVEERGQMTVLIEGFIDTFIRAADELRHQWMAIDDENKNKTEVQLIVQRHGGALQQLQAKIVDTNQQLQRTLQLMQTEFHNMGLPILQAAEDPKELPPPGLPVREESGEKKKKWFT